MPFFMYLQKKTYKNTVGWLILCAFIIFCIVSMTSEYIYIYIYEKNFFSLVIEVGHIQRVTKILVNKDSQSLIPFILDLN